MFPEVLAAPVQEESRSSTDWPNPAQVCCRSEIRSTEITTRTFLGNALGSRCKNKVGERSSSLI